MDTGNKIQYSGNKFSIRLTLTDSIHPFCVFVMKKKGGQSVMRKRVPFLCSKF